MTQTRRLPSQPTPQIHPQPAEQDLSLESSRSRLDGAPSHPRYTLFVHRGPRSKHKPHPSPHSPQSYPTGLIPSSGDRTSTHINGGKVGISSRGASLRKSATSGTRIRVAATLTRNEGSARIPDSFRRLPRYTIKKVCTAECAPSPSSAREPPRPPTPDQGENSGEGTLAKSLAQSKSSSTG